MPKGKTVLLGFGLAAVTLLTLAAMRKRENQAEEADTETRPPGVRIIIGKEA